MASGDRLGFWDATNNHPPSSGFAQYDTRNSHPILRFDPSTVEDAIFSGEMPPWYAGGSVKLRLFVGFDTATTGASRWQTDFERTQDAVLDVDADSFSGTFQNNGLTVPGTAGIFTWLEITHTSGQMDGVVAGDPFRIKVRHDATGTTGTDDATGDHELMFVEMVEV